MGNAETNTLLTIKKVSMTKPSVKSTLKFEAPAQPGTHKLTLYFMCDAYMGCDQASPHRLHLTAHGLVLHGVIVSVLAVGLLSAVMCR